MSDLHNFYTHTETSRLNMNACFYVRKNFFYESYNIIFVICAKCNKIDVCIIDLAFQVRRVFCDLLLRLKMYFLVRHMRRINDF